MAGLSPRIYCTLALFLSSWTAVYAEITVYSQRPLGQAANTASGAAATNTAAAAYDTTVLNPPPLPDPLPATQFGVQLQNSAANVQGLSIPMSGAFWGFSIEMSVANQVLGRNATFIQVPFLNLMSNLAERAGYVRVRVGGNTQDFATLSDDLPDGKLLQKENVNNTNPTQTPGIRFTSQLLYMMSNISSLTNVRWYLGIPLNETANLRLQIAEVGEPILGDNLLGWQIGNEPDLYLRHLHRDPGYGPFNYFGEFGDVKNALGSSAAVNKLIGPSVGSGDWSPEQVWDTNFIPQYQANLGALSVEKYPDDNCFALYGTGHKVVYQDVFANYLTHDGPKSFIQPFLNSTAIAQTFNKPFIMFETNTASCGGFPGVSNSFGSALWALDYGFQMAYSNFSSALLHVGGQNVFYNPFTPPPTSQSTFHEWTIGPVYYSTLIIAEAFGKSNQSRIIDLNTNNGDAHTPGYAIYDGDKPSKVALFNFMTDPSGANDYTANINIGGSQLGQPNGTPAQVKVKYLAAPSVAEKFNITWGGQTFGEHFASDGRIKGSMQIQTVTCDQTANTCAIKVPAPGFALVFLTDDPATSSDATPATFSTTALTKTVNTALADPTEVATSNGHSGKTFEKFRSTSKGSVPNGSVSKRTTGTDVFAVGAAVALALVSL
ncbi:hypothetical protein HGRIS_003363 [Hohenbuehelia grisea]|uniref:Beta-glucuronidase C-terminal domain-containing protein n=1 Tax=Hohenbuehelia grisea TaxID=104357 RepID=A0ABR3JF58_9AGAR